MPQNIGEVFAIHVDLDESAANTLTVQEIETQLAKVGSQIQALEIVGWNFDVDPPTAEPGQNNTVQVSIARDTDKLVAGGTMFGKKDEDIIDSLTRSYNHEEAAGVEAQVTAIDRAWRVKVGDDGAPPAYILKKSFDIGIKGTGNAGAKSVQGKLYCQLVRLNADELAQAIVLEELYD